MPAPKFSKRKPAKDSFIDLGDSPMEMPATNKGKPSKWYPSLRMKKKGNELLSAEIAALSKKIQRKKISKAKADLIIKDLWEKFNIWLPHYTIVNETILEVLEKHFEIVEIDADEIGDDFQI